MIQLSFPTIKLGKYIKEVKCKVKNTDLKQDDLIVYGVTNTEGITITNNKASDDLGNYTVLNENQFAYNPYRVNVGSIGLSTTGTFGVVSPAYVVFEATKEISSEFLLYYLKSDLGINLIKWYGDRGGVRSALRFSDLKEIDFPDIDLEKQLSILEKMKDIDNKLYELNENISLENISSLRQAILQQAVEGKLCEQDQTDEPASVLLEKIKAEKEKLIAEKKIKKQKELPPITDEEKPFDLPQGWEWCRLNKVAFVTKLAGFEFTNYFNLKVSGDIPVIRAQNVRKAFLDLTNLLYIDQDISEILQRCALDKRCLVMTFIGAGIGDVAIFDSKTRFHLAPNVAKIELYGNISEKYILYFLLSDTGQKEIFKSQKATAQPSLSMQTIREINYPLPPLAEQQRIVEKVDKLMALCDELEQEVTSAKKYASQLMEAVLQEAFTNKTKEIQDNVVVFAPQPQQANVTKPLLSAAARGKLKEATWQRITEETLKLANEES